jgi:hypothetical protein
MRLFMAAFAALTFCFTSFAAHAVGEICVYRGTAPFCDGACKAGETSRGKDDCFDGECCATGHKELCCRPDPNYRPVEFNRDRPGGDYMNFDVKNGDFNVCRNGCEGDTRCRAYTFVNAGIQGKYARCWLKSMVPSPKSSDCCVSGVIRP